MSYTPTEWESTDVVTATRMNALEQAVGDMNMSYTPNTWSDGDILSAEKMNALEQAVASGGGGGETWVTLTEESVTTTEGDGLNRGFLTYVSTSTPPEKLRLTFGGSAYECDRAQVEEGFAYGAAGAQGIDFSVYPVGLLLNSEVSVVFTETAGTYSIKIEAPQSGGSSDFSTAQVTVVNNDSESYFEIPMAVIQDGEMYFRAISEEATYTTPLYNGSVILPSFSPTNVSGNAEKRGSGISAYVEITGDCTITIS